MRFNKMPYKSDDLYDILKPALAIAVGSAAVRESDTLAEPPIMDHYGHRDSL